MTLFKMSCLTGLSLVLACLASCDAAEPANTTAPARGPVSETLVNFPVKRCINMGNALEAEFEGAWGSTIEAWQFEAIFKAGFDTVRIPVRWDLQTQKKPPYKIDPNYMARVQIVVQQALDAGLYVILDVHHYEALYEETKRETPRFLAIWQQIADRFQDAPDTLFFEPINEPFPYDKAAKVDALYEAVIPVIRKTHPTRPLILGGNNWSSIEGMLAMSWPDDPYIVASFHDYGPHEFTHQGNSWEGSPPPMGYRWGNTSDQKEFFDTYSKAKAFKARTGLPILVGEFGVITTVKEAERADWISKRRQAIEDADMAWCAWSFEGSFAVYNSDRRGWYPQVLNALIPN